MPRNDSATPPGVPLSQNQEHTLRQLFDQMLSDEFDSLRSSAPDQADILLEMLLARNSLFSDGTRLEKASAEAVSRVGGKVTPIEDGNFQFSMTTDQIQGLISIVLDEETNSKYLRAGALFSLYKLVYLSKYGLDSAGDDGFIKMLASTVEKFGSS